MKRNNLVIGLVLVLALSTESFGATIGGPALGRGNSSIGLEIGMLLGRDFEFESGTCDIESLQYLLDYTCGLGANWDGYIKIGIADSKIKISVEGEGISGESDANSA